MKSSIKPLLFSLKTQYAKLTFDGVKRTELRLRDLTGMEGRDVFVYVTGPVMELRGGFRIGEVFTGTPDEIWDAVSGDAGVDKPDFDAYYSDRQLACALRIEEVWKYENPIGLDKLRKQFTGFVVPQSWRYLKHEEHEYFQGMKRRGEEAGNSRQALIRSPQGQLPFPLRPAPA